jgi:hypothetical protein
MSIFTAMLIVVFVLVVIPLLYWIGLGLSRAVRQRGRGA